MSQSRSHLNIYPTKYDNDNDYKSKTPSRTVKRSLQFNDDLDLDK